MMMRMRTRVAAGALIRWGIILVFSYGVTAMGRLGSERGQGGCKIPRACMAGVFKYRDSPRWPVLSRFWALFLDVVLSSASMGSPPSSFYADLCGLRSGVLYE